MQRTNITTIMCRRVKASGPTSVVSTWADNIGLAQHTSLTATQSSPGQAEQSDKGTPASHITYFPSKQWDYIQFELWKTQP